MSEIRADRVRVGDQIAGFARKRVIAVERFEKHDNQGRAFREPWVRLTYTRDGETRVWEVPPDWEVDIYRRGLDDEHGDEDE